MSQGPSELLSPKLVGENFRKADLMIRQAGFVPGDISRVSSDTVERDIVIAQYPQAGSQLEKGGTISMLVSSGRKARTFVMPKLTGKKAEEALRIVDRMGLAAPGGYAGSRRQAPGRGTDRHQPETRQRDIRFPPMRRWISW